MKNIVKHSGALILFFCILGTGTSYAGPADSSATRPATSKNDIGVSLTPAYCNIFNYPNTGFFNMSYRAGISGRLGLNHSNSLYILAEAGYLQNSFTVKAPNTSALMSPSGEIVPSAVSYYNATSSYSYVYLSGCIGYTFLHLSKTKNDYLFAMTGLQEMFNFSNKEVDKGVILQPNTSSVTVKKGSTRVNDMNVAWVGGIGFSMNLSSKISATATPEISYELGSVPTQSFYNLGLNFQVLYNF